MGQSVVQPSSNAGEPTPATDSTSKLPANPDDAKPKSGLDKSPERMPAEDVPALPNRDSSKPSNEELPSIKAGVKVSRPPVAMLNRSNDNVTSIAKPQAASPVRQAGYASPSSNTPANTLR